MRYSAILAVFVLWLMASPVAHAATDLIQNGDFETGNTAGWSSVNVHVYRALGPDNQTTRSAQVGDVFTGPSSDIPSEYVTGNSVTGVLSQTVRVPFGSLVHLEFWYTIISNQLNAYGKAGLDAYLIRKDGSTIAQWSGVADSKWHKIAYDLVPSFEDQLTIKFVGRGDIIGYTFRDEPILAVAYVDDVHMMATPLTEWLPSYSLPMVVAIVAIIMVKFGREPEGPRPAPQAP